MVMKSDLAGQGGDPALATARSLCEVFQQTAARHADLVALRTAGGAEEITWREYAERVRQVAAGLAAIGVGRGDTVGIMLTNRPEAFIADTAALHLGATPFSIYNTSSPSQIEYLLGHADCRVVITEARFADQVLAAQAAAPGLEHVFVMDGEPPGALPFSRLAEAAAGSFDFEANWQAVKPDDVAVLIYTSGTTGAPKAVEITHANILAELWMSRDANPQLARVGRYMSYLPMAHLADRCVALYPSMGTGSSVTCFTDAKTAMASMPEVRPTFSATVPRMWEKLKAGLEAQFRQEPDQAKRAAIRNAIEAATMKVRLESAGQPVPDDLAETCRRADTAIFSAIRKQVGLDDADVILSGAAPIAIEVLDFFAALGLPILEVYGMTETATTVTVNRKDAPRFGTVGQPYRGLEVRLGGDGEVLIRGPKVMRGYRNDPEKTAEAIDADGWLYTGDIGEFDADGYLRIVDRKKDLIINSAGKNMSPSNIENKLKQASSLIGYPVTIGDRRPYNTALIVLDPEEAAAYARTHGLPDPSVKALAADKSVHNRVADAVQAANAQLSRVEQIKKFTILPAEWQPDSDELTPTLKLKRKQIAGKYAAEIQAMYAG